MFLIPIAFLVALGPGGYSEVESVRLMSQVVRRVRRETGLPFVRGSLRVIQHEGEFLLSPDSRALQNQRYFPMADSLTLVLTPPLKSEYGPALGGVASGICSLKAAMVHAPGYRTRAWRRRVRAYLLHELLHVLGARHRGEGIMSAGEIRDRPLDEESKEEVRRCVIG